MKNIIFLICISILIFGCNRQAEKVQIQEPEEVEELMNFLAERGTHIQATNSRAEAHDFLKDLLNIDANLLKQSKDLQQHYLTSFYICKSKLSYFNKEQQNDADKALQHLVNSLSTEE